MLTEHTYYSAVFEIFLNIELMKLIEILYEILFSIMAFIEIYAIKVSV